MRSHGGSEEFLMAESLMAKMVELLGGRKKGGLWRRWSAITVKPALRRASEAFIERSWGMGVADSWEEFLELECTAEEMAMTPSVTETTK